MIIENLMLTFAYIKIGNKNHRRSRSVPPLRIVRVNHNESSSSYVCLKEPKILLNRLDLSKYASKDKSIEGEGSLRKNTISLVRSTSKNKAEKSQKEKEVLTGSKSEPNLLLKTNEFDVSKEDSAWFDQWINEQVQWITENDDVDQLINDIENLIELDQ